MITHDCTGFSSFDVLDLLERITLSPKDMLAISMSEVEVLRFGYSSFISLAELYGMRFCTPTSDGETITLHFEKLDLSRSFHAKTSSSEKYGVRSSFASVNKNSKFSFLYHYQKALLFCGVKHKKRILNLGINRGDEFSVIERLLGEKFAGVELVGVDHSHSAIEEAKKSFASPKHTFYAHDINDLASLGLGRFDLIISIATLQSSGLNFNQTLMQIYQNHLQKGGSMLLGFPNCRWVDGEMNYGAKAPNYNFSEMSLLLKDLHFAKKYLQQKRYRVVISGKEYIFLSAREIG